MKAKFVFLDDLEAAVGFTSQLFTQEFVGSTTIVPQVTFWNYFWVSLLLSDVVSVVFAMTLVFQHDLFLSSSFLRTQSCPISMTISREVLSLYMNMLP